MDIIDDDNDDDHANGDDHAPAHSAAEQPPKRRRGTDVSRVGPFILVVIVCDVTNGFWPRSCSSEDVSESWSGNIIGVGLSKWVFQEPRLLSEDFESLADRERCRSCARDIFGYIAYPVVEFARLVIPIAAVPSPSRQIQALCSEYAHEYDFSLRAFVAQHRLQELVEHWTSRHGIDKTPRVCTLKLHPGMVSEILRKPSIFHIVGLSNRVPTRRLLGRSDLTAWTLKRLRGSCSGHGGDVNRGVIRAAPIRKAWNGMLDANMVLKMVGCQP